MFPSLTLTIPFPFHPRLLPPPLTLTPTPHPSFFGFTGGAALSIVDDAGAPGAKGRVVAMAVTNTMLASSASAVSTVIIVGVRRKRLSLLALNNGIVVGMVAICAGAGHLAPWASIIIGLIAGAVYAFCSELMVRLRIDDPVDAVGVHLGGGWWGVLAEPLFGTSTGVFYNMRSSNAWQRFAWNLAGSICIILWVMATTGPVFYLLKRNNLLRIDRVVEEECEFWGLGEVKGRTDSHVPPHSPRRH